jgi:hypothetical protein
MVTTHWDFVEVGFAMDDADVVRGLADADAAIGISFTKAAPPAPRLPPRRSPPQTGVRSDAGGD